MTGFTRSISMDITMVRTPLFDKPPTQENIGDLNYFYEWQIALKGNKQSQDFTVHTPFDWPVCDEHDAWERIIYEYIAYDELKQLDEGKAINDYAIMIGEGIAEARESYMEMKQTALKLERVGMDKALAHEIDRKLTKAEKEAV